MVGRIPGLKLFMCTQVTQVEISDAQNSFNNVSLGFKFIKYEIHVQVRTINLRIIEIINSVWKKQKIEFMISVVYRLND